MEIRVSKREWVEQWGRMARNGNSYAAVLRIEHERTAYEAKKEQIRRKEGREWTKGWYVLKADVLESIASEAQKRMQGAIAKEALRILNAHKALWVKAEGEGYPVYPHRYQQYAQAA